MAQFLIIPDKNNINESLALAKEYNVGFEYNDFFSPVMLDDKKALQEHVEFYKALPLPDYTTTHGDFFDVIIFSDDEKIREVSAERIEQSMEVAKMLNTKGVVFHTNHSPFIKTEVYENNFINRNVDFWKKVCANYPEIQIYIENMFDTSPDLICRLARAMEGTANFGLCLDYAHASAFGKEIPIETWVETLAPFVRHLHINDNDLKDDLHFACGDGKIDWTKFKEYKEKYFENCSILIEVTGLEKQRKSIEFLKSKGIM